MDFLLSNTLNLFLSALVNPVPREYLLSQSCLTRLGLYIDAKGRTCVEVKMTCPEALDEKPIEHRRDIQLKLEINAASAEPFDGDPLEYCLRVPKTKSVKSSGSCSGRTILNLVLEVKGATTGQTLTSACHACSTRESSPSTNLPMIDFVTRKDLIDMKGGKASVAFRFLCLPGHHGTRDEEYQ